MQNPYLLGHYLVTPLGYYDNVFKNGLEKELEDVKLGTQKGQGGPWLATELKVRPFYTSILADV